MDHIGDYVLFRNYIELIKNSNKYKDYSITLLGNSEWKDFSEELDNKYIDNFISLNREKFEKNFIYRYKKLQELASSGYEVILSPVYSREFFVVDNIVKLVPAKEKIGSIGKPISNGTFLLENENKKIIKKPNCNGELIYKGENVCLGYANSSEDLIKKDINNSVLRTGDIGYFDKDGFFYIVGKKSRYIKIAGNRISLDEIEKIIYEYGYKNVCNQQSKDTLNIFINEKDIEKKIISYVSNYTNLHESLFKVIFIESFPMTKNNKIDYNNKIFKNEN